MSDTQNLMIDVLIKVSMTVDTLRHIGQQDPEDPHYFLHR
jgi:hypothetical protein